MTDTSSDIKPRRISLQLTLDPRSVVKPIHMAVWEGAEVISVASRAIATAEYPAEIIIPGSIYHFKVSEVPLDAAERRRVGVNWLVAKGLNDLARAISQALQEAYMYLTLIKEPRFIGTDVEWDAKFFALQKTATDMHFIPLMNAVSAQLSAPLNFIDEFSSLQKIRNCNEHRGGIVGFRDTKGEDTLLLKLPRVEIFVQQGEVKRLVTTPEVELDTTQKDASVSTELGTKEISFKLEERIALDEVDYAGIVHASLLFADDLLAKLPISSLPPLSTMPE